MRKLAFLAILVFCLSFPFANAKAGALDGYKEFIAEDFKSVPQIAEIFSTLGLMQLDQEFLSSQQNDQYDYAIQIFQACKYDATVEKCLEDSYVLTAFFALTEVMDKEGNKSYSGELFGLVFSGPKIAWFKSEKAKQAYTKLVLGE